MPFVVTNRAENRTRAGHALVVRPFAAACDAVGWSPSARTFASRVNRSGSWRASRARPVECRVWRGRQERISLLLCSPGPHGPTAIDCPRNVPQSIVVCLSVVSLLLPALGCVFLVTNRTVPTTITDECRNPSHNTPTTRDEFAACRLERRGAHSVHRFGFTISQGVADGRGSNAPVPCR